MDEKDIYIKYEKKIQELEKKYKKKYKKKNSFLIAFLFVLTIVLIPFTIMFINYGINSYGWFANYDNMYKTTLPIEPPAKGGTLYLPKNLKFITYDEWNYIIDENEKIIATEVYKGYKKHIQAANYEWVDYVCNSKFSYFDFSDIEMLTNDSNNCSVIKYKNSYGIYFSGACYLKSKETGESRIYSKIYIFENCISFDILKKIDNSYTYGGDFYF